MNQPANGFPTATVERPRLWPRLAFVAALLIGIGIAATLIWSHLNPPGHELRLTFRNAHGLQVHDAVRYRGLDVGRVHAIHLGSERDRVEVAVILDESYADLARSGSRFWIRRPTLDWDQISGLDTLIGPRYIAVSPGEGELVHETVGLEIEPLPTPPGALPFVLTAAQRDGLHRGAAVLYRGLRVGTVQNVHLSTDGNRVEAPAYIEADHRHLLCTDSRFCRAPGASFEAGIGGIDLSLPPLAQLGLGGVMLVNTARPGEAAEPGRHFRLQSSDLLELIPEQGVVIPGQVHQDLPSVVPVRLSWRIPRKLWFDEESARDGWALPDGDGYWLPSVLLQAPTDAEDINWRFGEQQQDAVPDLATADAITRLPAGEPLGQRLTIRQPQEPETIRIRLGSTRAMTITAERLLATDGGWHLPDDFPQELLTPGAPAISTGDQAVVGMLVPEPWRVVQMGP